MITILILNQQQTGFTHLFKKHFSQGYFLSLFLMFSQTVDQWTPKKVPMIYWNL